MLEPCMRPSRSRPRRPTRDSLDASPSASPAAGLKRATRRGQGRLTREEIFNLVRGRLAEMLERDVSEITLDSKLEEDLEADSLDLVELAMSLEEELSLEIPDEQLDVIRTVGDAVDFVHGRLTARERG